MERQFQIFAPLNEKHFCPVEELFKGSLKSVDVFRRLREAHWNGKEMDTLKEKYCRGIYIFISKLNIFLP